MALRKIFCSNCGQPTYVNDQREFCFCQECGNKIQLQPKGHVPEWDGAEQSNPVTGRRETENKNEIIEEKLKEVEFYYKLSREKEEAGSKEEPVYYLKAQDLLIDMSQKFPDDYRIWWELCKPLDYDSPFVGEDICSHYSINQAYFDKALDLAGLDMKKELIARHDDYTSQKHSALEEMERKRETARQEQRRRQAQEEEQKRIQAQREELERMRRAGEEQMRQQELMQRSRELSGKLWADLSGKNYSSIDGSYFHLFDQENKKVICVFRVISNILYLSSFCIDSAKNNTVYRDQTISVKIDAKGVATKFDNRPVRIKGMAPPNDVIRIYDDGQGGCTVNRQPLMKNAEYVNHMIQNSRRPVISLNRTFV